MQYVHMGERGKEEDCRVVHTITTHIVPKTKQSDGVPEVRRGGAGDKGRRGEEVELAKQIEVPD